MSDFDRDDARARRQNEDVRDGSGDSHGNRTNGRIRHDSNDDRSRDHGRDRSQRRRDHRERGEPREDRGSDRRRRERRHRARSGSRDRSYDDRRSRSPPSKRRRRSQCASRSPARRSRAPLPSQIESFRGEKPPEKRKPNYKPTGLLAKEANTVAGTTTVLRYHEPPEGRKPPPKQQWRMYVFKSAEVVDTIYIHTRSCWLAGRDMNVTDLLLEHPSISKQHAVIQFRLQTTTNEFGDRMNKVKPYLIDLESANGTKLNGKAVEASRYVELVDGDAIVFGDSEREYVMMLPPP